MILRPYYAVAGCDAFIEALANVPAKPAEMEQILAFNRGHAEMKVQA